ncbi:hypothetical protein N825_30770 [Skermanella stibiiresistens SB22]|uniref:Uncharacterized protein n=1 Tax=Skermanella stibiiresistens SB22 TaxID=1385369 RepID=W9HBI2_9PROT|nr:hypothetical protein N825_30770 [Skermanella stibiiresistens SB22]
MGLTLPRHLDIIPLGYSVVNQLEAAMKQRVPPKQPLDKKIGREA